MTPPRLNNRTARRLFMDRHALVEKPAGKAHGEDLRALIQRLGFVQLDSINTLARAHDMILFSRRPTYRAKNLKRLYERDRALFEHWTHDAAVIPMEFYPHWQLRFRRDAETLKARWRNWRREGFEARFQDVLRHIQETGPVCAADVGKDERKSSDGWWDWHPSKTALEYLWRSGALTVVGRNGFQKQYDLTERVIETRQSSVPDAEETIDWLCNAALDRLGFATSGEIAAFWATVTPTEARDWCARQVEKGRIIPVDVTCHDGALRRCYIRPDSEEAACGIEAPPRRIRIMSPFDPALRDRTRAQRLFGFHYRIEVFVPAAQRKYGYYVFPLLEGDRLIGRMDAKARREEGILSVRAVWPERSTRWSSARTARLQSELDRVARFAGLDHVVLEKNWLRGPL